MKNKSKPFFIFIEGADGTGKTTTSAHLEKALIELTDKKVVKAFIMQSTEVGKLLRHTAVEEDTSEALKYFAFGFGVFYGLEKLPAIHQDADFVIVDRSQASTYAQSICAANHVSETTKTCMIHMFNELNKRFKEKYKDNHLFVHLSAPADQALARLLAARGRLDILEQRGVEYQEKINNGYTAFYDHHTNPGDVMHFNTIRLKPEQVVNHITLNLISKGIL